MEDSLEKAAEPTPNIWKYGVVIAIGWTLFVAISIFWNLSLKRSEIERSAIIQAEAAWQKDIVYRRWNASHGGVYVPVTEETPANPYLEVPNRDIQFPDGRLLTLINPAYMIRQVNELGIEAFDIWEHITSLKPIRPENRPDQWEINALQEFERNVSEVSSIVILNNEELQIHLNK